MQRNRLVEIAIGHHVENRREGFMPDDIGLFGHFRNGGCGVIGSGILTLQSPSAAMYLAAIRLHLLKRALHSSEGVTVNQRADK